MAEDKSKNVVYFILAGITLVSAFAAVAKVYFVVPDQVARLKADITELKREIDEKDNTEMELRVDVTELKTQIQYIREDTKQILQYVKRDSP